MAVRSTWWSSLALALACAACATGPGGPTTPSADAADGSKGGAQGGGVGAAAGALGSLAWQAASAFEAGPVRAYRFDSKPLPNGPTVADLIADRIWNDDFDPKVPGRFAAEGYAEDGLATNATIETRGKSTRESSQKSYRIALGDAAASYRGEMDLLLNKHPYEISRMRNKLAFDLFQELPQLMAPMTGWATLQLDGQDTGLYTQIERLDKAYLRRHGLAEDAMVYKGEFFEFEPYPEALKLTSDPTYKKADFEQYLEITVGKDHAPLLVFLRDLNDEDKPIAEVLAQHVRLDDYLTWFACNVLMDNVDTNSQNFYLYRAPAEGRWRFIPWDFDTAWGYYPASESRSERKGRLGRSQDGAANWWGVTLHRRVLQDAGLRALLLKRMDELLAGPLAPARIQGRLQAYRPVVLKALQGVDGDRLKGEGGDPVANMDQAIAQMPEVPKSAHQRFLDSLQRPMPVYMSPPERSPQGVRFHWDKSFDLQGDPVTYDLTVAKDAEFTQVVAIRPGLTEPQAFVDLPAGTYYWTLKIQDPAGHWQWSFDTHRDEATDTPYHGVLRSEVP